VDFNGSIGERGARNWEEEGKNVKRKSKDKVENNMDGKYRMEANKTMKKRKVAEGKQ
jgi:hypothetical protein